MVMALTLAATSAFAQLQHDVDRLIANANLRDTEVGLLIQDLDTGDTLASRSPDQAMIPASNMKLISSATALTTLGPDFMFRTQLRAITPAEWNEVFGRVAPVEHTVLRVNGDGDPAFGDEKLLATADLNQEDLLQLWVKAVANAGVSHVSQLIVDDRVFDHHRVHPSWPEDQLNNWYCAPVAGINFNDNCLDLYPRPSTPGAAPHVRVVPASPFLNFTNKAVTGGSNSFWVHRDRQSNELSFRGIVDREHTAPVSIALHDPAGYFGQLLAHRLGEAGITVDAVVRPHDDAVMPQGRLLHVVQTPLAAVLERCNKDSQNLFAEALLKRAGHALVADKPGSWFTGGMAAKKMLTDRVDVRTAAKLTVADGSGMSRDNRVTAAMLVQVLDVMYRDRALAPVFRNSLAVGGEDGTLRKRFRHGMNHNVYAKSGYIRSVSALSGYVMVESDDPADPPRRTVAFSILLNGFAPSLHNGHMKALQNKIVEAIDAYLENTTSIPLGG